MFCFEAEGKLPQVGKWNTFVSVFPIKYCVELDEPLDDEPLDDEPLDEEPLDEPPLDEPPLESPLPEPVLSVVPLGKVNTAPLVENTMSPFLSVRYTETPAEESLFKVADVG